MYCQNTVFYLRKDQFLPLAKTLEDLITQIQQLKTQVIREQEKEILKLCLQIAEKVIHTEVKQNPKVILANLKEGIKSIKQQKIKAIKLNPEDLEIIQKLQTEDPEFIPSLKKIPLEPEPSLPRGGCLINTELGYVEASIESQFQELKKELEEKDGLKTES